MSDSITESLSAFVDGEASTDESARVLQQLAEDKELQREWKNYHTIATVFRNENVTNLQAPKDWDALAAALPSDGDILPFQPLSRVKSMLVHGGIGAGLAACVMVAMFFVLSSDRIGSDPSVAINASPNGNNIETIPIEDLPLQQLSFDETFDVSVSTISPEIREELRQITLEALHAYDISRSGIDGSLMPAANVVSRNVSKEL